MNPSHHSHHRLGTYLTVGLGTGCLAVTAGASTVTMYGAGTTPPPGIGFRGGAENAFVDNAGSNGSVFHQDKGGNNFAYFTRGGDKNWGSSYSGESGQFRQSGDWYYGAQAGASNYANISFNGFDNVYEAVGQFFFDAQGGGYLIALAKNDDGSALTISAGKTAIDAASAVSAVPEPSSQLALLALGSAGILIRRRIKRAA
jgi:hypothetical protein